MLNANDKTEFEQQLLAKYDDYEELSNNLYKVTKGTSVGAIKKGETEEFVPCEYKNINEVNGVLITQTFDDKFGAIKSDSGKFIYHNYAEAIEKVNDNIFAVLEYNNIMLFKFNNGESVKIRTDMFDEHKKSSQFDFCEVYGNNSEYIKIGIGNFCGVVSGVNGNEILPCINDEVFIQDNHIRARRFGYCGIYSKTTGKPIIPCKQETIIETQHFYITALRDKQSAYLKNGALVVRDVDSSIIVENDGIIVGVNEKNGVAYKFFNNNGKSIFSRRYSLYQLLKQLSEIGINCTLGHDKIEFCGDHRYLKTYDNDKIGIISTKTLGNILKGKYEDVKLVNGCGFMVKENGSWGFIAQNGTRIIDSEYENNNLIELLQSKNLFAVAAQRT